MVLLCSVGEGGDVEALDAASRRRRDALAFWVRADQCGGVSRRTTVHEMGDDRKRISERFAAEDASVGLLSVD